MVVSPSPLQGKAAAGAAVVEQVYLTHCAQSDSVRNEAGFSIRATSTGDEHLLKFALDYPGLELPLDMLGSDPAPADAPRRLALVEAPDGRSALVHSAYLPRDTRGRPGSYFTHVLFCEAPPLAAALETWGSSDWRVNYDPGEPRDLESFPRPLPTRGTLDPDALAAFLGEGRPPSPAGLALATCPERLWDDPGTRRTLLEMALAGCLLILDEAAGSPRQLQILGEPGLCAMLLYGVACLLPGPQTAALTFSTYEPMHRSFRHFRAARVVCTYTADHSKGLESDPTQSRGYALDTLDRARSSPELRRDGEGVVRQLVTWATGKKWKTVAELHRLHGAGSVSVSALEFAWRLLDLGKRLHAGEAKPEELLDLPGKERGQAFVDDREDQVWTLVSRAALTDERTRTAYASLLRRRVEELKHGAAAALAHESWENWAHHWGLLAAVREGDGEVLQGDFVEVLRRAAAGKATARLHAVSDRLLKQWRDLKPPEEGLPEAVRGLLAPATPEELDRLQAAELPAPWWALALRRGLEAPATRLRTVAQLCAAEPGLLHAVCRAATPEAKQGPELFGDPSEEEQKEIAALLERLLGADGPLPAETLDGLLERLGAYRPAWDRYWSGEGRLAALFERLRDRPDTVARLWERYGGRPGAKVLRGDAVQVGFLKQLREERARCADTVPASRREAVEDWGLLRDLVTRSASAVPQTPREQIEAALKRRGLERNGVLLPIVGLHFKRFLQAKPTDAVKFGAVVKVFEHFYPLREYSDEARFQMWLRITAACPDQGRKEQYQMYYLLEKVEPHRVESLVDGCQEQLSPAVAEQVNAKLAARGGAKKAGAAAARPRPAAKQGPSLRRRLTEALAAYALPLGIGLCVCAVAVAAFLALSGPSDSEGEGPTPGSGQQRPAPKKSSRPTGKDKGEPKKVEDASSKQDEVVPAAAPVALLDREAATELAQALKAIPTGFVQFALPGFDSLPPHNEVEDLTGKLDKLVALLHQPVTLKDQKVASADLRRLADEIRKTSARMKKTCEELKAQTKEGYRLRLVVHLWALGQEELRQDIGVWETWCIRHLRELVNRLANEEPKVNADWLEASKSLDKLDKLVTKGGATINVRPLLPIIAAFVASDQFHQRTQGGDGDHKEKRLARWKQFSDELSKSVKDLTGK